MALNNEEHFNLIPLFKNIKTYNGQPSDVDMFYLTPNKFLIIGEFKNGDKGVLGGKQKWLFETFIDNYKYGGIIVYATHHSLVQKGDTNYDAAKCEVEQYYFNGQWRKPRKPTIVQDIFNKYDKEKKMEIISDREEMIFRKDFNDKTFYSIGLSKKNKDGQYTNGYMNCQFKGDADIKNQTKIKIKEAWLSFYLKDKATVPYVFINDYEITKEPEEVNPFEAMHTKVESDLGKQITIEESQLPF